jgi:hypothetical protein
MDISYLGYLIKEPKQNLKINKLLFSSKINGNRECRRFQNEEFHSL